jgi:membrane fusion protein (multidrug efflux system)
MKNYIIFPLIASTLLLSSCSSESEKETVIASAGPKSTVDISIAKAIPFTNQMTVSGTILPNESVQLITEASGIVASIQFEESTPVKKGQVLLTLDHDDLKAELALLDTQLKFANKNQKRAQQIYDEKGISEQELDNIQLQNQELEAKKLILLAEIAKHKIVAPFSGNIGLRNVSIGTYIGANSPITSLVDPSYLKIEFSISEEYANTVNIGDSISFKVAGESTKTAVIYAKEASINAANRSLLFRAKLRNDDNLLLSGAFSKVKVRVQDFDNAVFIPNQAIVPELNGKKVFIYKNGAVQEIKIKTGIRKSNFTHVTEGLKDGDTIVVAGLLQIRDGVPATVRDIKTFETNF